MKNILHAVGLVLVLALSTACGRTAPTPPEEKPHSIAFAYFGPEEACDVAIEGYLESLTKAGFIEGQNLTVIRKHAGGEIANIAPLMQSLDNQGLDIIVPMSTPCVAGAAAAVKKTRVVFCYTYDPIAASAGADSVNHLPNFTGVGSFPPIPETMDFLKKVVPGLTRIGTVYNPSEANSVKAVAVARRALEGSGIVLEEASASNTNEVLQAAQAVVTRGVEAVWITGDNTAIQGLDGIIKTANDAKLPLIVNDAEYVPRGVLAAVGIGWRDVGRRAGEMAAEVLRGADPSKMPFESVAGMRVVLNRAVAAKIGVVFPPEITALE